MSISAELLSVLGKPIEDHPLNLDDGYTLYQKSGGLLPKARYIELLAVAVRDNLQVEKEISPHGREQALFMARFAGLELSQQEVFLYAYSRNIMSNGDRANSLNPDTSSQYDVYQLSDQMLLAEIFRMEGKFDILEQFATAYSNILKNDDKNLTEPKQ